MGLALAQLLNEDPDVIFVLSDGYENTPAGGFAQVLKMARDLGCETPVYQIAPVAAAEAAGIKDLAPGLIRTLPTAGPNSLGSTMLKAALQSQPEAGLRSVIGLCLKQIESTGGK